MPAKGVTVLPQQYVINLHSIFCKIVANSNMLFGLLEPHSSFRLQYRLLTMKTFFEIAIYNYVDNGNNHVKYITFRDKRRNFVLFSCWGGLQEAKESSREGGGEG